MIQNMMNDMNPQDYEALFENLYAAGALEVFLTPTIMKKSRPGILLTVLCQEHLDRTVDVLFEHTTSIGFREWGCHLPTHIARHRHVGPHERPCFQACARAQPAVTRMEILRYTIGSNMFQKASR